MGTLQVPSITPAGISPSTQSALEAGLEQAGSMVCAPDDDLDVRVVSSHVTRLASEFTGILILLGMAGGSLTAALLMSLLAWIAQLGALYLGVVGRRLWQQHSVHRR